MANIISGLRIVLGIFLIFIEPFGVLFYIIYISGGISDVLDGIIARKTGKATQIGEKLDTIADMIFLFVILIKLIYNIQFPIWIIGWTLIIAIIKCINIAKGYIKYKQFVSLHTIMNKICGIFLFFLPIYIKELDWEISIIFMIITCIMATFSSIQEGYYIRTGKNVNI